MFFQYLMTNPFFYWSIVGLVIFSIALHELAHGLVAVWQGDKGPLEQGTLSLNPFRNIGLMGFGALLVAGVGWGEIAVNDKNFRNGSLGTVLVALAGPLANLTLTICFSFALSWLHLQELSDPILAEDLERFLYWGAICNALLFSFNLLPFPPLDGYKVAREFFPSITILERRPELGYLALGGLLLVPGFVQGAIGLIHQMLQGFLRLGTDYLAFL